MARNEAQGKRPGARIEIVIHGETAETLEAAKKFDLDRIPDPEGRVRALVTQEELDQLRADGLEVEVGQQHEVAGLDPALVMTDEAADAWLNARVRGIRPEKRAD